MASGIADINEKKSNFISILKVTQAKKDEASNETKQSYVNLNDLLLSPATSRSFVLECHPVDKEITNIRKFKSKTLNVKQEEHDDASSYLY